MPEDSLSFWHSASSFVILDPDIESKVRQELLTGRKNRSGLAGCWRFGNEGTPVAGTYVNLGRLIFNGGTIAPEVRVV